MKTIEIKLSGMCEGCEYADLDLDYIDFQDGRKKWFIECEHRYICERNKKAKLEDDCK